MAEPITITAAERDLLLCRIWIHTSGLDGVWLDARSDPKYSSQEVDQVHRDMHQILDDLADWRVSDEGLVDLETSLEVLRRVFEFMLHLAGGEDRDDQIDEATEGFHEYENRQVRAMCVQVLEQLDESPTAPSGKATDDLDSGSAGALPGS